MDLQMHIIILRFIYLWAYPCLSLKEPHKFPGKAYVCECGGGGRQASE